MLQNSGTAPQRDRNAARWLNGLARKGGIGARLALVLPLFGSTLLVIQSWLLATALHQVIAQRVALDAVIPLAMWLAALMALRALLGIAAEVLAVGAGEAVKVALRRQLVADLFGRPPTWTAARPSGALAGLVVEQVEAIDGYFVRYLPALVQAAIMPIAFAAVAFSVDWLVGLLFLITAPLIPVFMALAGLGAQAASEAQAGALARLSGCFADRLRGMTTLKLFGRAEAETASIHDASEELRIRTMRVMRIAFLSSAVLEFFAALGVAGVALYVGLTFLDLISLRGDKLTLQAGLFCLLLAPDVYQPLRLLAAHYHDRASAKAAAIEIAGTLGVLPAQLDAVSATAVIDRHPGATGPISIRLADVGICTPTGQPLLSEIDLDVAPARHVAIIGPSGSGKSTLLEALARLRDHEGDLGLDGIPLRAWPEGELRTRVALLGQRPRLFAGTIAQNIRLGRPGACTTAVSLAAHLACVDRFTDALPHGLDAEIGENGLGLSGGELQRIALARIYLRDPGLILLDEPTAHLDVRTEAAVLDGLAEFAAHRTLIVATHSPAVAARMDEAWRVANRHLVRAVRPVLRGAARSGLVAA